MFAALSTTLLWRKIIDSNYYRISTVGWFSRPFDALRPYLPYYDYYIVDFAGLLIYNQADAIVAMLVSPLVGVLPCNKTGTSGWT